VGRIDQVRAAQAYMLISMPTGSSTIFGAFQDIFLSSRFQCESLLLEPGAIGGSINNPGSLSMW
jgi:hypothetical protein